MGKRVPRRRYTGVPCTRSMCFSPESPSRRISSSRLTWGITNRSPPLEITSPGMMARVRWLTCAVDVLMLSSHGPRGRVVEAQRGVDRLGAGTRVHVDDVY